MRANWFQQNFVSVFVFFFYLFLTLPAVGSEPVHVMDSKGRVITLAKTPERIGCLYAFCGHVVTMLDRGPDMVAIVNGLKKDLLLNQIVPSIKKMPVPAKGGIINIEALLKTRPDIIFLKPETAAITAEIKKLERFKLPYFVAGYRSMAQQMAIIENMGKAIGRYDKALAYTRYYKNIIKKVSSITIAIPNEKRQRLYHSINEATRTDAPGTIEADWTKVTGVINVSVGNFLHTKGNKHFADIEQIIIWNPDVIIVNEDGVDKKILTDKKWASIKAVQNKQVYAIPVGISRWGHPGGLETPLAILWTAKKVYPKYFLDIDLRKEIQHFYKTFFNIKLNKAMIDKILANKGMR
ncbi:MAG: ABC transporter substrate-binding protein [Pseudomonadota bacterium]